MILVLYAVPAGIGGESVGSIGHERYLIGFDFFYQIYELTFGVALYIELGSEIRFEYVDIGVSDMSFVRAGVYRDTVGSETLAVESYLQYIRYITATCIAECGYFIYIYTQTNHYSLSVYFF